MTLRAYFHVTIDTDARSPDAGHRLEVLLAAAPFGSAEACRRAVLDAYRPSFPGVAVRVAEGPALVAVPPDLAPGVYGLRPGAHP